MTINEYHLLLQKLLILQKLFILLLLWSSELWGSKTCSPLTVARRGRGSMQKAPSRSTIQRCWIRMKLTILLLISQLLMLKITILLAATVRVMMMIINAHWNVCEMRKIFLVFSSSLSTDPSSMSPTAWLVVGAKTLVVRTVVSSLALLDTSDCGLLSVIMQNNLSSNLCNHFNKSYTYSTF